MDTDLLLQVSSVYNAGGRSSILKIRRMSVQQQIGGRDCGLFAVAFATEVCHGRNPCDASLNQGQMRVHLYKCLQRGEVTAFPQTSAVLETVPRPKCQLFAYKINCYCGMPDEYDTDMIECERCNAWIHFSCAGIQQSTSDFICSACLGQGHHVAGKPQEFCTKYPAKKNDKC